ncbi:MAG: RagB/SusD family nutrient uptake outer membrane protein [Bacteroidales bacterium]|nr:RagB/SusD family nutrient uptake outer membrane protein [Bacteroidales bacterium]
MKKIFYPIIAILAGLSFVSCDDMLDILPKNQMTADTFFKNDAELKAFSINLYGNFPGTSLYIENSDSYIQMTMLDEIRDQVTPENVSGWSWGALRNINTILDYLPNCKDEQTRTYYEAFARFFRAYFYFEKVKRFGEVPWYDTQVGSTDVEKLNRPRDSRDFIMGKMIDDIDFAYNNLPGAKSAYEVTKWTALALKSNFLLFEGTFRKYHTEIDFGKDAKSAEWYLQKCVEASEEFITTSPYSIRTIGGPDAAYYNLFTTNNATELMDEVILARNYNLTYGVYHNSNYTMLVASMGKPGMTKKLVASYLCKDGSRFTGKPDWETMEYTEEVVDRDPRLAQSIRTPGYFRLGDENQVSVATDLNATMTGYQPIKYVTTVDQDIYNGSDCDLIIYRAAEIMLNYAEAKAELGTLEQNDLDISVNKLRDRVGMPHLNMNDANADPDPFLTNEEWGGYQNVTGANKGVILEIRRERSIELCQEGRRYYDIIRWKEGKIFEKQFYGMYFKKIGEKPSEYDFDGDGNLDLMLYTEAQKVDGKAPKTTAKLSYCVGTDIILSNGDSGYVNPHKNMPGIWHEDRNYLYPIPKNERSLTDGALTQNPGWDDGLNF